MSTLFSIFVTVISLGTILGCFFVTGMLLMAYNAYRTVTAPKGSLEPVAQPA